MNYYLYHQIRINELFLFSIYKSTIKIALISLKLLVNYGLYHYHFINSSNPYLLSLLLGKNINL